MPKRKKSDTKSETPKLEVGHVGHSPDFESAKSAGPAGATVEELFATIRPPMRTPPLRLPGGVVKVKKLDPRAQVPQKGSDHSAAFDLYALEDADLKPGVVTKVRTGLSIALPAGYKGEIYSRSGLACKGVSVVNQPGKIDEDYRGEVIVLLRYDSPEFAKYVLVLQKALIKFTKDFVSSNQFTLDAANKNLRQTILTEKPFAAYHIQAGDRIAQFEIQVVEPLLFVEVDELPITTRGEGGLGSTGR